MYQDCLKTNSWATINDLYDRYGEEFVDKLSIRRSWDDGLGMYVANESKESMTRVQILALDDAKALLMEKISSLFVGAERLNDVEFYSIKQWHIKLAIETLKKGGDCKGCDCLGDIDEFLKGKICSEKGCLEKRTTFFQVYGGKLKCESSCGCKRCR